MAGLRPARRARHHWRLIESTPELLRVVGELLAQRWSPRPRFPSEPGMRLGYPSRQTPTRGRGISTNSAPAVPGLGWVFDFQAMTGHPGGSAGFDDAFASI